MPGAEKHFGFLQFIFPESYVFCKVNIEIRDSADNLTQITSPLDKDGKCMKITLPAPPPENSRISRYIKTKYETGTYVKPPYYKYNVCIETPEKDKIQFYGIQIFPDTTTIHKIASGYKLIMLPPHGLWFSSEIENEQYTQKEAQINNVLNNLKLPQKLIVHQGDPDDMEAENIEIEYKNYIAAVVSGMIYPTWNTNAIRAIVLLLNSFILNRLQSSYYRSSGYNFDITADSSHDYSYAQEYGVFDNIRYFVEDIDNLFAADNNGNPVLYCNNIQSNFSLWDANELAEKGFSVIEILQHYLGDKIRIQEAESEEFHEESATKNIDFGIGSRGIYIMNLQEDLNTLSKVIITLKPLKVDGIYNTDVETAVINVQKYLCLPQTGRINERTWNSIVDLKYSVENGSFYDYPGVTLKIGCCGYNVKRLKNMLILLGKKIPSVAVDNTDGIFDSETEKAIIKVQQKLNCIPDGKVDKETWDRIVAEIKY
ncbi:MAG: hypothetical protein A2Y17_10110 [Clostridiales bacterium GWF2_38_85]|nr:MAG: hypothetical protein A2Y17_10110 [Clostridiales bacterium GWF2_38_85]HBL84471.1 hypothetical protein [Clostridiales bacterium]